MSIVGAHLPRADDLDAIAKMSHVTAFQVTTARKDNAVTCGWRAIANDRRYEASLEPGDTIADVVARARVQLAGLADGDDTGLTEATGRRLDS